MKLPPRLLALLGLLASLLATVVVPARAADAMPAAPVAERRAKDVSVHGERRIDDYFWLREKGTPRVTRHLQREAAYTAAWLAPHAALTRTLYDEMVGRIRQDDSTVPVREGAWWYYSRHAQWAQYPLHLRRRAQGADRHDDPAAPEAVLLDVQRMARGRPFLDVRGLRPSPDGRLLAYVTDERGGREFRLRLKDLASGRTRTIGPPGVSDVHWAADGRSLYYVTQDATKRPYRLWRHALGSRGADTLLLQEDDAEFSLDLDRTQDGRYLVVACGTRDTSHIRVIDAGAPGPLRTVVERVKGREASLEHQDGRFLLLVNDSGPDFRLVSVDAARPDLAAAEELVPHRAGTLLDRLLVLRDHRVLLLREGGALKLRVWRNGRAEPRDIAFDEAAHSVNLGDNREYDTSVLRFEYESLATPPSIYDEDLATGERALRKVEPVLGGFDAGRYASERLWVTARDGTPVPVSLVWRRDLRAQGPQPLLLYGYGSYGLASDPWFSSPRLSLLDRGVVFAIAHVRGGNEMGRSWYLRGKLEHKVNSFNDFVDVAESLVAQGRTTPGQLVAQGGSAGGLLMGAVLNQRPDLFKAVVAEVPFVDVINTMMDATIPLTTAEYIEWGNPAKPAEYAWMRAYSPYDNLRATAYPAVYLQTALEDANVPYWEAAKFAARLRALKTNDTPVLLDINLHGGHGGASGRFDALRERARVFAFMLQQWGLAGDGGR